MLMTLARNWWAMALRGLAALIFGIAALIWPQATLTILILLFGVYAIADGILSIIAILRDRTYYQWWLLLLEGIVGITAGVLTFIWPEITGLVLLYVIAAWAVVTGILEIIAAIRLREEMTGEWLLVLGGIVSVIFGVLLVIQPQAGALAVAWIIGIYAIFFGIVLLILSLRLRSWYEEYTSEAV
jgi:uncharacterized membrane protein HdeD (DUF308 family)